MAKPEKQEPEVTNIEHALDIRMVFEHRGGQKNVAFGNIGTVDLQLTVVNPVLNGQVLNTRSVKYLVAYGLRKSIADVFAGASTREEAVKAFDGRVAKIIAGTMSSRRRAMDEYDRLFNRIVDDKFNEWSGMTVDKFYETMGETGVDKADKVYATFVESIREGVETIVKELIEQQRKLEVSTAQSFDDVIASLTK